MIGFLRGAIAMSCLVSALFFLRFWRDSRERLMLTLACAFLILGGSWTLLATNLWDEETDAHIFAFRALAFGIIALGVLRKNQEH
ncbi:MAG: DUF5985 family protein [Myxococcota bacterium]